MDLVEAKNAHGAVIDATAFRPDWQQRWTVEEMKLISTLCAFAEYASRASSRVRQCGPS